MLIFNFHHVEENIRHESRRHISVTPEGLRNFIRTLRSLGMEPACLKQIIAEGGPKYGDNNKFLITFDDGYENVFTQGVPVLQEENCPATIFVLPGKSNNDWDQGDLPAAERDQLMTLEQMKALAGTVVSIGSHGMEHRDLPTLSKAEIEYELLESYRILEKEIGENFVPVLAYPWGHYSQDVVDVVAASEYRYAFTVEKGYWRKSSQPYEVPRYSAYYRDGNPLVFLAKLARNGLIFPGNAGSKVAI